MEKTIEVKNLNKTFKIRTNKNIITGFINPKYKEVNAVIDISFSVNEGESVAFLGPNGAGKTTTTKMLSGLMYPTSGEINVLGYKPFDRKTEFLMQIGLVMGNKSGLSWDLTPKQSFYLLQKIYKIEDKKYTETLDNLCQILEIGDYLDTQVRKLSLGERMKVELIGAILHSPRVLFLDEPTIGLDITSRKNIRKFLRKLQKEFNITLILTSHDMDDISGVCDKVMIINKGKKIYDNSLEKLISDYSDKKYVKVYFKETPDNFKWLSYGSAEEKTQDYILFEIEKDKFSKFVNEIVSRYDILDLDIIAVPLDDVIEDVFKREVSSIV